MSLGGKSKALEIVLKAKDEATKVVDTVNKKLGTLGKVGMAGAALEGAGLMAMKSWDKAASAAIAYGGEVITIQRLTGASAEDSSAFAAILARVGGSGADAGKIMKVLSTQILATSNATNKNKTALGQMGIATKDANGANRATLDVLADVAEYYAKSEDKTKALALASKALGRGYQTLLPILAGGKKKISELTESAKENGLILGEQSVKEIGKYKAAAAKAAEAQKGMRIQFGLAVVPIKTFIMDGIAKLFGWYNKLSPATKKIITYVGLGATAFALIGGPLMVVISMLPMLSAGIGMVSGAMSFLVTGPAGLVIAIIGAIIAIVVLCIKYHKELAAFFKKIWGAIAGFFSAIWSKIKAAFWAFINFFRNNWRAFLKGLLVLLGGPLGALVLMFIKHWKQIKAGFLAIGRAIKAAWTAVINWFKSIPGKIKAAFSAAGRWLVSAGKKIITGLWSGIKAIWQTVTHWFSKTGTRVKGALSGAGRWLWDIGKAIISGMWNGIKNGIEWLGGKIKAIGSAIKGFFKKALGINSPSREMVPIGEFIMAGVHAGMKAQVSNTVAEASRAGKAISNALRVSVAGPQIGRAAFAGVGSFAPSAMAAASSSSSTGGSYTARPIVHETRVYLDGRELTRTIAKTITKDARSGGS